MDIKIIDHKISNHELRAFLGQPFSEFVKLVVDIEKSILALGGEMHVDAEQALLAHGSRQPDLWGANIYPDEAPEHTIVFESLINIRPAQGNRSTLIQDVALRGKVAGIIHALIEL